jgi:hypothetical protein
VERDMGVEQTVSQMLWVDMLLIAAITKSNQFIRFVVPNPTASWPLSSPEPVYNMSYAQLRLSALVLKENRFEDFESLFCAHSNQACHCMENISRHLSVNKL